MIDLYIYCNTVRLFSLCLPLLDVGIDSLQEHLEIHLQKYSIRLVVLSLEECRPKNPCQSDETKIKLFGNKHQRWVWRRQKDSHTEKTPIPNVKYGGESLMLWGCFSSKGPGHLLRIHGIMDSIKYQQILNENLTAPSSKFKMGCGWTFQHTSTSTPQSSLDR